MLQSPPRGQGSSARISAVISNGGTFAEAKFTAMINSSCRAPLRASDNPSRGCCVRTERKTPKETEGGRGKEKKKPNKVRKNGDSKAEMAGDSYRPSPAAGYQ